MTFQEAKARLFELLGSEGIHSYHADKKMGGFVVYTEERNEFLRERLRANLAIELAPVPVVVTWGPRPAFV